MPEDLASRRAKDRCWFFVRSGGGQAASRSGRGAKQSFGPMRKTPEEKASAFLGLPEDGGTGANRQEKKVSGRSSGIGKAFSTVQPAIRALPFARGKRNMSCAMTAGGT